MMCRLIPGIIRVLQLMRARGWPHTTVQNVATFANQETSSAADVDADKPWMKSRGFVNELGKLQG
jgi:hypothetical protein